MDRSAQSLAVGLHALKKKKGKNKQRIKKGSLCLCNYFLAQPLL